MLLMRYLYHCEPQTEQENNRIIGVVLLQQLLIEDELAQTGVTEDEKKGLRNLQCAVITVLKKHVKKRYFICFLPLLLYIYYYYCYSLLTQNINTQPLIQRSARLSYFS